MRLLTQVESATAPLPTLDLHWDVETEILAGRFVVGEDAKGFTGSVEFEGSEGSVIVLDVERGVVCGVEIVVWPTTAETPTLATPENASPGRVLVPARPSQPGIGAVAMETAVSIETSSDESTVHVRIGPPGSRRTVRVATNLLVELDTHDEISGLWLLDVPPFPEEG